MEQIGESDRLIYEKLMESHAAEMTDLLCDPRVYEFVDEGIAPTPEHLVRAFRFREAGPPEHRNTERWLDVVVRLKSTKEPIGRIESTVVENRAEVAYLLGADYWRQGYGSESLTWLEGRTRDKYAVTEFWATVTPGNIASRGLLLKHGYADVSDGEFPTLKSYNENDWVFFKAAH